MSDDDFDNEGGIDQEDFAPSIDVVYPLNEETEVPQTNGKLFKTVTVEGTGSKPPVGARVTVHYTGTLVSDGSKFDSSRDRNDTFEFVLGQGQVIKGWDKGVATMRKGERAILRCEPEFAYGAAGSPPKIPANAALNFDVELISWSKREDVSAAKDSSIEKSTRVQGQGWLKPDYESAVQATISIVQVNEDEDETDGAVLVGETPLDFTIGDHPDGDFPEAIEQALKSFKKGETSAVDVGGSAVNHDYAPLGLKAGAPFRAILTVKDFTKISTYDFKGMDKVTEGLKRKDQGNAWFQQQNWSRAIRKYERALEFVESDFGLDDEQKAAAKKLKIPTLTNLAQALINTGDFGKAIEKCDKCLALDGVNVKALFRRAKANHARGDWELAKPDLVKALQIDPANGDVQRELAAVQEKERAQAQRDKARYGNLFAKLAAMEEAEHRSA